MKLKQEQEQAKKRDEERRLELAALGLQERLIQEEEQQLMQQLAEIEKK